MTTYSVIFASFCHIRLLCHIRRGVARKKTQTSRPLAAAAGGREAGGEGGREGGREGGMEGGRDTAFTLAMHGTHDCAPDTHPRSGRGRRP